MGTPSPCSYSVPQETARIRHLEIDRAAHSEIESLTPCREAPKTLLITTMGRARVTLVHLRKAPDDRIVPKETTPALGQFWRVASRIDDRMASDRS